MSQETHVHIVPAVPPAFNGLSDYCYKLWQHWPQPRPAWCALAPNVPPNAQTAWPQVQIASFELGKAGLLEALEQSQPDRLVLHYVGYAYDRKGVPLWLPGALAQWKRRHQTPLCVMFHELWSRGSPRQSAFWLQPLTKNIVVQLANLADSWITSSQAAASKLIGEAGADPTCGHIVPIGSAIEPQNPVDWERPWPLHSGGKLRLAIFGLPSNRAAALRAHRNLLQLLLEEDRLESVALIGKAGDANEAHAEAELRSHLTSNAALWREYHDLSPADISIVLAQQHAALTHYPPDLLTKSSVYPAFCLHGLVTICDSRWLFGRPAENAQRLGFQVPHLPNEDTQPAATVSALNNATTIRELLAATRETAQNQLSWNSIVGAWLQVTALTASR